MGGIRTWDDYPWDSTVGNNGLFTRFRRSGFDYTSIYGDYSWHMNHFDDCYINGKIYHVYAHPASTHFDTSSPNGQLILDTLAYVGNRKDVWYAGLDQLSNYHYLATVATPSITSTNLGESVEVTVSADSGKREKYGLGFPLTYRISKPAEWPSNAVCFVYYRDAEHPDWVPMTEMTTNDYFNAIDCYRDAGDSVYVSQGLPQWSDSFDLKVTYIEAGSSILQLAANNGDMVLSWPTALEGCTLQTTTNLMDATSWTTVTNVPVMVGEYYSVTSPAPQHQCYYRLVW